MLAGTATQCIWMGRLLPTTVVPAQAGTYRVYQSQTKGAIGSSLRWSDVGWS
jgi:hypothetical protein